jgi:hypothetical protein
MRSQWVRFGSTAVFDLGASNRKQGHLRVRLMNDDGQWVGDAFDGPANAKGFQSGRDLVEGIASAIHQWVQKHREHLSKNDRINTVLGIIPGQAFKNQTPLFINLEQADGVPLSNVDFNQLPAAMQRQGSAMSEHPQVLVLNDMMGAGAAITAALLKDPQQFQPGHHLVLNMTGGGCGVADIMHKGDHVELKATELGHQPRNDRGETIEAGSASVPALLNHFSKALKLTKTEQAAITGAKAALNFDTFRTIAPHISHEQHQSAVYAAVDPYLTDLARILNLKLLEGANAAVLTGPVNQATQAFVNANPDRFQPELAEFEALIATENGRGARPTLWKDGDQNPFQKVLLTRLWSQASPVGKSQICTNRFHIRTDIHAADNTAGGPQLRHASLIGGDVRSNWVKLPL